MPVRLISMKLVNICHAFTVACSKSHETLSYLNGATTTVRASVLFAQACYGSFKLIPIKIYIAR